MRISLPFFILSLVTIFGCMNSAPFTGEGSDTPKDIYIVPDLETYIHYISLWDADNQFPVFIGETGYTKKFAKAYGKAKLKKVPPVKAGKMNAQLIYKALYASWGPEKLADIKETITREKLRERLAELDRKPLGIVITNPGDMEFPGGFALAAGHKQLLDFYESKWPFSNDIPTPKSAVTIKQKETIRRDIYNIIRSWDYSFAALDDDIDYITLALDIQPGTYLLTGRDAKEKPGYSLDDAINRLSPFGFPRDKDGKPTGPSTCYAYVGRLLEADKGMANYQAMCSLFLDIRTAFYFDWWPEKWRRTCKEAEPILKKGLTVVIYHQSGTTRANLDSWRRMMKKGNTKFDFIHVNAAGTYNKWRKATTDDIPVSKPVVVFFAHSFAAKNPKNNETIIGRWLRNGAYITYGSRSEPTVAAFPIPKAAAQSIVDGEPFGKAFQDKTHLVESFRIPWKLIYIGDPLRRIKPECKQSR